MNILFLIGKTHIQTDEPELKRPLIFPIKQMIIFNNYKDKTY